MGVGAAQQGAEHHRAADHAQQQHHIEQRDDARSGLDGREIGGEGESRRLRGVQAGADQQERERCGAGSEPRRGFDLSAAAQHHQREGHHRKTAVLQQRAHPDIRHSAPTEHRPVVIGAETEEGAERREQQRQRHHRRDQPRGDFQFDDHDAVERAVEQRERHADGDLEEREAQQPRHRQVDAGGICKRQHPRMLQQLYETAHGCGANPPAGAAAAAAAAAVSRASRSFRKNCSALMAYAA